MEGLNSPIAEELRVRTGGEDRLGLTGLGRERDSLGSAWGSEREMMDQLEPVTGAGGRVAAGRKREQESEK